MKEMIINFINKFYYFRYNPTLVKNRGMAIAWNGKKTYFKKERLDFLKEANDLGDNDWSEFLSKHINTSRAWEYFLAAKSISYNKDDVVLDVGAYNTYFCNYLAKKVKQIYAVDNFYWAKRDYITKHHQELTMEEWISKVKSSGDNNLVVENQDLSRLSYPDNYFDKVIAISVIEHVIDDQAGLKEVRRVLKKDGIFILTTEIHPAVAQPYIEKTSSGEDRFYRVYGYQQLIHLLRAENFQLIGPDYLLETLKSNYPKTPVIVFLRNNK